MWCSPHNPAWLLAACANTINKHVVHVSVQATRTLPNRQTDKRTHRHRKHKHRLSQQQQHANTRAHSIENEAQNRRRFFFVCVLLSLWALVLMGFDVSLAVGAVLWYLCSHSQLECVHEQRRLRCVQEKRERKKTSGTIMRSALSWVCARCAAKYESRKKELP